jgi:hypothetical protein
MYLRVVLKHVEMLGAITFLVLISQTILVE